MDEWDCQVVPFLFSWHVEFYIDFVRGIITPQHLKVPQKSAYRLHVGFAHTKNHEAQRWHCLGLTMTCWREWHWNTSRCEIRKGQCLRRSITSAQPYSILLYIKWECRKILNLRVKNWVRKIVYFAWLAMMAIQKRGITYHASIESSDKIEILHSCALKNTSKHDRGGRKHKQCTHLSTT
jgi:hypothetical protein